MNARMWCLALALAALAAAAHGCTKKRSSTVVAPGDDDIFTTDEFPGTPVQDANLAEDARALSPADEIVLRVDVSRNGRDGSAMAVILTSSFGATSVNHIYASHFNGHDWTPAVALSAPDALPQYFGTMPPNFAAFLNTAEHSSDAARDRDGDCVIFWLGEDADDDGAGFADDVNTNVYSSYFDASLRDEPAANHGFQVSGVRLSVFDADGENIFCWGFVSDALCGEASFGERGAEFAQADATSGLVAVWSQRQDNDILGAGVEDTAVYYAAFDLAQQGPSESPLVPGPSTRLPILTFGASDSGISSEETLMAGSFRVYNHMLFVRVHSDDDPMADILGIDQSPNPQPFGSPMDADDDSTVQVFDFDLASGAPGTPTVLGPAAPNSTDAVESSKVLIDERAIYGPDEGLASVLVFFCSLGADIDESDFGEAGSGSRLYVQSLDAASGDILSSLILDDEYLGIFDNALPGAVIPQISRNGDYIACAWLEPHFDGAVDDLALHAAFVGAVRLDEDGAIPPIPDLFDVSSPGVLLSTDVDGFDPVWVRWQDGLHYVCGAQSDPDVMNLFYELSDGTQDVIHHARLTFDLAANTTTAAVGILETFEDGEQDGFAGQGLGFVNFAATDAGENGDVLAAYRRDVDPTAGTDFRLFARRTGAGAGIVEIGSALADRPAGDMPIRLVGTPPGEAIGRLDPLTGEEDEERAHPWSRVHVLFHETNTSEAMGSGLALRTRFYDPDADATTLHSDRFSPEVPGDPVEISLPFVDPDVDGDALVLHVGVSGDIVGLFTIEMGHGYYQEFDPDRLDDGGSGWLEQDGASDPALIDDDAAAEIQGMSIAPPACACDSLSGAIALWRKSLDSSGSVRLQLRVRDSAGE
jgi:hypothetical protein